DQTFEVDPDVRVDVDLVSGRLELHATATNELRVHAKGQLRVDGSRHRVSVRAPSGGFLPWSQPIDVDVRIDLPPKTRLTARSSNGGIEADGVAGELDLHSANGAIEVVGAPVETYLETMNAAIRFSGERSAVVAKTLNGAIDLRGVSGEVQAN